MPGFVIGVDWTVNLLFCDMSWLHNPYLNYKGKGKVHHLLCTLTLDIGMVHTLHIASFLQNPFKPRFDFCVKKLTLEHSRSSRRGNHILCARHFQECLLKFIKIQNSWHWERSNYKCIFSGFSGLLSSNCKVMHIEKGKNGNIGEKLLRESRNTRPLFLT